MWSQFSPLQRDTRHLAKTRPRKKLRVDPDRNYLQLPKEQTAGEREHNPQTAVVDESRGDEKAEEKKKTAGDGKHKFY